MKTLASIIFAHAIFWGIVGTVYLLLCYVQWEWIPLASGKSFRGLEVAAIILSFAMADR